MNKQYAPLISVCIPCYKNPELLSRCLQSIVEQTYKNIEIIITDDSPNDEVKTVIDNYIGDQRIRYFKNSNSLGSPENWNAGLRQAKGDYIKIMHHDDWFSRPDSLEIYVKKAFETNADFICAGCYNVSSRQKKEHKILTRFKKTWSKNRSLILYANYLGNPSTILFKRPTSEAIFYDIKSIWYVDVLFYYEYIKRYQRIAYVDEFLIDTSAGLDTQVTNSAITARIGIGEFIYVAEKHQLYEKNSFLTKLSLIEILKRYNVKSKIQLEAVIEAPYNRSLPYYILKLPIHHQIFNILKHLIILF